MEKYIIAGLKTQYHVRYDRLREQSRKYEADFDSSETEIIAEVTEEMIQKKVDETQINNKAMWEYMLTGHFFYKALLNYDGFMLHSSCVEKDGFAYLFSANSGTGKSTHTHLWLKNLSGTRIINDDKPALLLENGIWYACGTPFSGKTNENVNAKVPLRAVVFIKRGEENRVKRISTAEAIKLLYEQTIKISDKGLLIKTLELIDNLLTNVPAFELECNMDDGAAIASYNGIERLIKNED